MRILFETDKQAACQENQENIVYVLATHLRRTSPSF